jgi:phospholipid/cholesterol/gamma-HCH transport system substrate-binding protein
MSKRAPSTSQLVVIAAFALSCFGILLFLWITFGGPTPFKAKPYILSVPFKEATQLAEQSDVRISGVSVGKVQNIELSPNGKYAQTQIYVQNKYAPLPMGTRAVLRTKTIAGETYVELTPGDADGEVLPDGGTLPVGNVAESVQLDEFFRTFDAKTRAAFQTWMQEGAVAIQGQGQAFSNALGEFEPAFEAFDELFRALDSQRLAVRQLFRNGAISLQALRGREGQLATLIQNSNTAFQTAAERDRDIEALFRAFPTFLDESRLTFNRLKEFSLNADPLMRQLVPAAEELSPLLIALGRFAPQAKGFFDGFATVIARSPTGFPALRKFFRDEFPPALRALDPFLRNLNPILTGLGLYKNDITSVMANIAAATNARTPTNAKGVQVHYLRTMGPFGPESLASFPKRLTTNRNSAYSQPLFAKQLAQGLLNFDTRQCSSGATAALNPNTPNNPVFNARTEGNPEKAKEMFERLKLFAFGEQENSASTPAPGCSPQPPFEPIYGSGPATSYQHTFEQGE